MVTQEQLLEKAARDYPAETEFLTVYTKSKATVVGSHYFDDGDVKVLAIYPDGSKDGAFVLKNGQWAEIVSKPEQKIEIEFNPKSEHWLVDKQKHIDIESDPRYKELLDEEAKNTQYAAGLFYNLYSDALKVNDINDDVAYIEKSAQRRYFEEKLAEKDNLLTMQTNLVKSHITRLSELSATIEQQNKEIEKLREQENEFYEDQISKLKKEIEQLKQEPIRLLSKIRELISEKGVHYAGDFIDREYRKIVPITASDNKVE